MTKPSADAVRAIIAPAVHAEGLALEGVDLSSAGRRTLLRVTVDLPPEEVGSLGSDALADVSRAVSAALDALPEREDPFGGSPYVLEVSTPGTDRPLLRERGRWSRARTRLVRADQVAGGAVTGRLAVVDDDGVLLVVPGERGAAPTDVRLAWDGIAGGTVQVELRRPDDELTDDALPGELTDDALPGDGHETDED